MGRKKTHDEYVADLAIKNPIIKVVDEYIDAKTPIKHYCEKHDKFWNISPTNALSGCGCADCGKEKVGNKLRKTHEEYTLELSVLHPMIEVLEQYINASTSILHRCKIDGHIWPATPNNLLFGYGCPRCANNIKKVHVDYVCELAIKNPDIEAAEEYSGANTPILHKCKKHNVIWPCTPSDALRGRGCCMCSSEKIKDKLQKPHDQYIADVQLVNEDIIVLGEYIGNKISIEHGCKICGHRWNAKPYNILSGKGCSRCNESSGERRIRQWLQSHEIKYIFQKTFDSCIDKSLLPFDFYLSEHNICIEYDGGQHFFPVDLFGGEDGFKKQQLHDEIKNQYCQSHNIPLLRIPYNKNIEEELEKFFIHLI